MQREEDDADWCNSGDNDTDSHDGYLDTDEDEDPYTEMTEEDEIEASGEALHDNRNVQDDVLGLVKPAVQFVTDRTTTICPFSRICCTACLVI